jgi:uncharacterized membrane protein
MALAAAEKQHGELDEDTAEHVKAIAAATDNVGLFFGEDIFIAIGSILLMVGFLEQNGIKLEPLQLSVFAIPTAVLAFLIHSARLLLLDRSLTLRHFREGGNPATAPVLDPRFRGDDGKGRGDGVSQ